MMPSSPISDHPPSPSASSIDAADNNLQPFFVLHKASSRKSEIKPCGVKKARRKIDLPSSPSKSAAKADESQSDDAFYEQLRIEAFDLTWSKIHLAIKEVLRKINLDVFNEVHQWISESLSVVKSVRAQNILAIQRPFPIISDAICKQIPTGFILTKNAEFVDDLLTFQELSGHLKSSGCHVANLTSLDFSAKHGIGNCLRSLLRQLVTEAIDVSDITMLASWYCEPSNCDRPVIVIIDDMERCNGETLAEFINLLSEWVIKIPIFFIMGVATTVDAPRKLLASDTLQRLQPFKFTLGSPCERMDALTESVLVKTCSGFNIGHKVAVFLRNYFFRHDGTVTSLVRALKIACIKHFSLEPLSFLGQGILDDNCEKYWHHKCEALPDSMRQHAFEFPSCQRAKVSSGTCDDLIEGLSKLRILQRNWSSVVLCLFEVGKLNKMQLLDIFCEAADPSLYNLRNSDQMLPISSSAYDNLIEGKCGFTKGGFLAQAIQKVRELSVASLSRLLTMWSIHTREISQVHDKVKELQSIIGTTDASQISRESATEIYKKLRSAGTAKGMQSVSDKAAMLLDGMVRNFLIPIESIPFHEVICFKNVDILQAALIGDPRRTIQVDLLKSQSHLQCSCCGKGESISPSMHDTSIMYNLAQEYGDLINLHDWYQSFKVTTVGSSKTQRKAQKSPASKKMKTAATESEATTQARFCRAVTELQIAGLLRMPSKRRPDFVQRVAFGL
ncbi:uncharacterized protein A4U43_C10F570 [Asparagus officinalis]|uniref:Uncharacterized protein n=1 Tax=Asparagus officinalis TaxID=4686 RepID=A0A5P1E3Y9_ASPOF|nr:origin of replication complex subunit 3 [Asparagus officinalis]XP_020248748.1 origin of replication complex subunit 3 [Asparagus officinalis]XP_020248749.1 origin of replication complex subunit 3 [Asparagus officinalis]ONK55746.1 uncharacterized protein A4U43_C10F570 [Asparagus officinalis]